MKNMFVAAAEFNEFLIIVYRKILHTDDAFFALHVFFWVEASCLLLENGFHDGDVYDFFALDTEHQADARATDTSNEENDPPEDHAEVLHGLEPFEGRIIFVTLGLPLVYFICK
jgi:hypothetical protein